MIEDIAELLPQLGRAAKAAVQDASSEVGKLLRPEKLRPLLSDFRYGTIIPEPFRPGQDYTQDGFMLLCAYQGWSSYAIHGLQPVTIGKALT